MQPTTVTAKAWILMDANNQAYIRGLNTQQKREIASLTKMYTLYACLSLNKSLKINPDSTVLEIFDTAMTGTTANLRLNEYIRLKDLYYGLMLPSGNDAACILAYYYGMWLTTCSNQGRPLKAFRKESAQNATNYYKLYSKKFIQYLNRIVVKEQLNHKSTYFQNPHGLADKNQVSTAWELGQACLLFLKNPQFTRISSCFAYSGTYYQSQAVFQWQNTNILLREGYSGIKTGLTATAGGCLASLASIRKSKYDYQSLLIIVLGSEGADSRFEDTRFIVADYKKYLQMMKI